jgi:DHA2 family multidrug resistance protein-like MFS transporter
MFGLLVIGVNGFRSRDDLWHALVEIGAAAAAGFALVRRQRGVALPILPVDLLRRPVFALSMTTSVTCFASQSLSYVALPFYFEDVLHLSERLTGLLMTAWPLGTALIAPFAGRLADRYAVPGKLASLGLLMFATGAALVATLPPDPSLAAILWRLALCGLGFGLFQSPNNKVIIGSAPRERSGGASGLQSTGRLVGQSVGAAMMAVVFSLASSEQMPIALWIAFSLSLVAAVASALRS